MKKIIIAVILIALLAGGWYAYREYHRTNKDLTNARPAVTVTATSLIAAFEKDSAAANRQYLDKIIAVKGTIKKMESDNSPAIIFLGEAAQMSSVQCSMDSSHARSYSALQEGTQVTIKGMVTGARTDELFGTDVVLNRCVIEKDQ